MDLKYISQMPRAQALALIEQGTSMLKMDYEINLGTYAFNDTFGRILSFDEFAVMMLLDKDIALRLKNGKPA